MKRKLFAHLLLTAVVAFVLGACSSESADEKPVPHVSILANGSEIADNQVVQYIAEPNPFDEFVAGHDTEPTFSSDIPCKLEVTIDIPENQLDYFQWCGISHKCDNHKKGTFTRVQEKMNEPLGMELHAHFQKTVYTSCRVKVDVKANGERVRTFYLEYVYENNEVQPEPEPEPEAKLSVMANGKEISEGEVISYQAAKDLFGSMVAGHDTEPVFSTDIDSKLEVTIDIPENKLDHFQWCGITKECVDYNKGSYTRTLDKTSGDKTMELHAYFKAGVAATCRVNVVVKLNDKVERSFVLEYVYTVEEEKPLPDTEEFATPAKKSPVVVVSYTGQNCRYCPDQERSLEANRVKYGKENYFIAALHSLASYSQFEGTEHVSLYNEEASRYSAAMEIQAGLPHLVHNSVGTFVDDTYLEDQFKADDLLECTGSVVAVDGMYKVEINTRLRSNQKEFVKDKNIDILLWALENDIKAIQNDNGKWTYPLHQHIFRGSVNGFYGEKYEIGTPYHKTFSIPSAVSVVKNTDVIVFFKDHVTGEVYDAAQFKVN